MKNLKKNHFKRLTLLIIVALIIQLAMPFTNVFSQNTDDGIQDAQQEEGAPVIDEQEKQDEEENEENINTQSEDEVIQSEDNDTQTGDEDTQAEQLPDENNEGDSDPEESKESSLSAVGLAGGIGVMADGEGSKDWGNIFTNPRLTLNDVEIKEGDIIDIDADTTVQLEYDWNTEELDVKAGDTASIQLPDIFKQVNVQNQPVEAGGVTVGTYSIASGVLTITFNEEIEDGAVSNGFIGLNLEFDLEKFMVNVEQEIKFNDIKNTTLNVIAKPDGEVEGIDKEGEPDSYQDAKEITWTIDVINVEGKEITNAVVTDNIPEGLELDADSFKITELIVGYEGDISLGDEIIGIKIDVDVEDDEGDEYDFKITLPSMEPYKGYRIQYTTTITDYTKTEFTNDATLSYGETNLPASTTVDGLKRSDAIEKEGKYLGNDVIEWTIDVNKSGGEINNAIVYDKLPDGLTVVGGSIEVYRITKDGDDWKETEDPIDTDDLINFYEDIFSITLGELKSTDAYRIKFKTEIDYSKVNDGKYQEENSFTNETELYDGEHPRGEAEKEVVIEREPILSKTGVSNVSYDENSKTLTWTVTINEARHPLGDVVLTDYLPAGLSISKENITITSAEGKDYEEVDILIESIDDEDDENAGKTKVEIKLTEVGTDKITILYTTEIDDFTVDEFENIATLEGDGVGEGGEIKPVPIRPPANSFNKSSSGINYNEKTMSWTLTIDPIREPITELKIIDTFPNNGMILLPETLEVKQGNTVLVKDIHYTLEPYSDADDEEDEGGYHKGFILAFIGPDLQLNAETTITYDTSFDPEVEVEGNTLDPNTDEDRYYKNKAKFEGKTKSDGFDETRTAQRQVIESSWNSGKKEGQLVSVEDDYSKQDGWVSGAERKIAWQLYINYLQQNLGEGVVVEDTLDYDGTIDEDSIKVSVYTVGANGETTITEEVLSKEGYDNKVNYTVVIDQNDKKFTLTFAEDFVVDKRYVIEFTTTVPNISQEEYTNNATVKVREDEYLYSGTVNYDKHNNFLEKGAVDLGGNQVYTGDEIDWEIKVNESLSVIQNAKIIDTLSPGLVYVDGSLEVYKLEGTDEISLTQGQGGDYTFAKSTTAEDGTSLTLEFNEAVDYTLILRYKTVVIEKKGTVNNKVEFNGEGIENVSEESSTLTAKQFSWVGGDFLPNRGAIKLTKVDAEEEVTIKNNEATFELWYELNGERVQYTQVDEEGAVLPFTTENGVLEIGNLPIRTYYLIEVESPEGYVRSEEEIEITVEPFGNDKNYHKVEFKNTKEKIDVTGTKEWVYGEAIRPESIELQLYQNGAAYGDPVQLSKDNKSSDDPSQWVYTWEDLDKTDIDGNEYEYTVDEVEVPENYGKEVSEDGLKITNTYTSPTTDITATKDWVDGPEEKPTVWFKLFRQIENGDLEEVEDAEIQALSNGTTEVTWVDLDVTDHDGNEYIYSVQEVDADGNDFTPENYEKTENVTEEGPVVTNHYVSPKDASAKATKVWEDGPSERPTTWFKLYRYIEVEDGEEVKVEEVPSEEAGIKELPSGTTEVVWNELTKTDTAGNEYKFLVKEVDAEGEDFTPENYVKSEDGLTVTNSYVIPKVPVTGTKVWEGGPQDRPTIELQLYKDGEPVGEPVTLKNGQTEYTWEGLDETDINGKEHVYTVEEVDVPENYTSEADGLTVTNTYVSPKIEITGNKVWIGAPLEKPDIELQLFRNGEAYGDPVPLKDGATSYTWTDLDLTDLDGVEYVYTIDEVVVPKAYRKTFSEDGLTVINTYDINLDDNVPGGPGSGEGDEDKDGLPKTGMASNLVFYIAGMVLILLGAMGVFYNRRKKVSDRK